MSSQIVNRLKQLDAYPKTLDDYRIKTFGGGAVTIISYTIIILLIISELNSYLTPDVIEELFVDTSREPKLRININITVPSISCKYLVLDAMDSSGEQHLQIEHSIFKIRIDKDGRPIDKPQKEDLLAVKTSKNETVETSTEKKCGSCHGAESEELNITCCNTCADVRNAYMKRRWAFPAPELVAQCRDLAQDPIFNEGCIIYGEMEVNRVGGSFHIAPGESFSINHVHVHDIQPYASSSFNTSHTIDHLSFGYNIPGKTNPMDGTVGIATEGSTMFQYYIKIVPTIFYYHQTNLLILTNQFSVTRHQKSDSGSTGMPPGIFFSYEMAPFVVRYTEKKRSFGHFATNICAIIGGVFTVASLIDAFLYRSLQALQQKVDLGKAF